MYFFLKELVKALWYIFFFKFTALRVAFSFCNFVLEERLLLLDNEEQFCELLLGG